jgi:hypothetical protein
LNSAVQAFFSDEELNRLARETEFTKRPDGKISGSVFFDLIVFNSDKLKEQSLNDLSLEAKQRHEIEITKQSLHDRFNEYAPVFLKAALEKLLQKQILKHVQLGKWPILNEFCSRIPFVLMSIPALALLGALAGKAWQRLTRAAAAVPPQPRCESNMNMIC